MEGAEEKGIDAGLVGDGDDHRVVAIFLRLAVLPIEVVDLAANDEDQQRQQRQRIPVRKHG
jgi:hypothetical protein